MWDMIAALTTAVLGIFLSIILIFYDRQHLKEIGSMITIPGPSPTDKDGNVSDINAQGGLVSYLVDLHKKWGDLAAFWIGKQFVVTTSTPAMFKKVTKLSDKPAGFLSNFKHVLGETSIWYANGLDWQERRHFYQESFGPEYLHKYFDIFCQLSKSLTSKWQQKEDGGASFDEIQRDIQEMTCAATFINLFGDILDETKMKRLTQKYVQCIHLTESLQHWGKDESKLKSLEEESLYVRDLIKDCVILRQGVQNDDEKQRLLIDRILEKTDSTDSAIDECLAFLAGGLYKISTMLTWAVYYLATNPDAQSRLRAEVEKGLGSDLSSYEDINALRYLRQFINETLRCSKMSPFLARQTMNEIIAPGGIRVIPKKTPVIQCLAQEFEDPTIWQNPMSFDPDHFDLEKMESRVGRTFEPFGYAGKRRCPGMRYAYLFTSAFLVHFLLNCDAIQTDNNHQLETRYGLVCRIAGNAGCEIRPLPKPLKTNR